MNSSVALKNYGHVKINAAIAGASPHALVQMLYEGLLERIAQMKGAVAQKDIELKGKRVNQAIAIVSGLRESLNPDDQGGSLAVRLDGLYDYIQRALWRAHLENDLDKLDECTQLILEISTAWKQIAPN